MMAGTKPLPFSKSTFISSCLPNFLAQKHKTRHAWLRRRAEECFVWRIAMHTSAGAACGRDDDADAPELCVCVSSPGSKIEEIFACVNRGLKKGLKQPRAHPFCCTIPPRGRHLLTWDKAWTSHGREDSQRRASLENAAYAESILRDTAKGNGTSLYRRVREYRNSHNLQVHLLW